ncbi:MAG: hypothetical protein HYZ79_06605 [Candidatus Melainabacteria bacterium]|nr:hypothetical protein [Candidatus Melainabacteria bacterium]
MPNLNQAIKKLFSKAALILGTTSIIILCCASIGHCQSTPVLPQEFSFLSLNSKALEINDTFTVDENTPSLTQLNLTKTGTILYIVPEKRLDANTNLKVIAEDTTEAEFYSLNDNAFFALVDPEKSYKIIQELIPSCSELTESFNLTQEEAICPDKIEIKLIDNLQIIQDTGINISPLNSFQIFKAQLDLSNNLLDIDTNLIATSQDTNNNNADQIALGDTIKDWKLCIKSRAKIKQKDTSSQCLFDNSTIDSIITFHNDFKNKTINSNDTASIIFPLLKGSFKKNKLEYIVQVIQSISPENNPKEIQQIDDVELLLEDNNYTIGFNLGEIGKSKTKVRKNIFNINTPLAFNKSLNKITFAVPKDKLELTLTPFNKDNFLILSQLSFSGESTSSSDFFDIILNNNINLKNEEQEEISNENETLQRAQTLIKEDMEIETFIPEGFNTTFSRTYSQIQQNIAPTVTDTGETIGIVNDKSRLDIEFAQPLNINDFTNKNNITLDFQKASKQLESNSNFNLQKNLSGFLIPPDFQPVLIEGYRATIRFFMTLALDSTETLNISYQELKTKDETPFANGFNFLFLPFGTYDTNIKFNGERENLFATNGVFIKEFEGTTQD